MHNDLTLTVVRHGNTFASGEAARRIGARTDISLVDTGREQASAIGRSFAKAGMRFDRATVGPLQRTRETAGLILAELAHGPVPEGGDWLTEIDHGPDEDQSEEDVRARIGDAALAAWDQFGTPPSGWIVDRAERLGRWRELLLHATGDVLVVTSNGAARFALLACAALQAGISLPSSMKLRTGAWGRVTRRDGVLQIEYWDRRP